MNEHAGRVGWVSRRPSSGGGLGGGVLRGAADGGAGVPRGGPPQDRLQRGEGPGRPLQEDDALVGQWGWGSGRFPSSHTNGCFPFRSLVGCLGGNAARTMPACRPGLCYAARFGVGKVQVHLRPANCPPGLEDCLLTKRWGFLGRQMH